MTDHEKPDLPIGAVGYAILLGAPIVLSRLREWEHTFCEDCENWTKTHVADGVVLDGLCRQMAFQTGPRGPLWSGCRGFKLRGGAPGPAKRYTDALKEKIGHGIVPGEPAR